MALEPEAELFVTGELLTVELGGGVLRVSLAMTSP